MAYEPDYKIYHPELIPWETLNKALNTVLESKVLLMLGWLGGLITIFGFALYYWLYWTHKDKTLLIEKQIYEQAQARRDHDIVNDPNLTTSRR